LARRCPTCSAQVPPRADNPAFPFCSERCRLIDLGRWLGEEYRVPSEPETDAGSPPEPPPPPTKR
jgi:endogenous inhibitor of DNA gyrase (YacG/DUF329 family)